MGAPGESDTVQTLDPKAALPQISNCSHENCWQDQSDSSHRNLAKVDPAAKYTGQQMFHDKGKHFHTWNQATQIWTSSRQRQVRSGTLVSERGSDEQDWSRTNQSRRQRYKKSGMALQTIGQGTCPQPLQKWTEDAGHMQLEALVHPLHVAPTAQSLLLDFLKSAAASPVPARQKRTHTRPRPNVSRLVTFGRRGSSSLHVPSAIIRY